MTAATVGRLRILARITFPSILIAIGYVWFCFVPNQRLIQIKRVELEKRLASSVRSPKSNESLNAGLTAAQAKMADLSKESETLRQQLESQTAIRSQSIHDSNRVSSPANAVASTLELLRRHSLVCIDCGLIGKTPEKEERQISGLSKATAAPAIPNEFRPKTKYRIRVQGRFQDLRLALLQMQEENPTILALSIDMDATNPLGAQRDWTLVILI